METGLPLVTVVVATYRCDDFLRLALGSILAQTHENFEVLVADDGGEDATRAVVAGFHDPRLVYYRNPVRLGAAANHWEAIRRARGEFVAILNHDDLWQPTFLARMLAGLRDPAVVVAFSDHDVIDSEGRIVEATTASLSRQTGRDTLRAGVHRPFTALAVRGGVPTAQAAVMRRSALDLGMLPGEAGPAYDFWLNYVLARTGGGAAYVPERLASWRTHPAALSRAGTRPDWPAGAGTCWERIADDPAFADFHRLARRRTAECYAGAALASLRGNQRAEARRYARQAVAKGKISPGVAAIFLLAWLPRFLQARLAGIQSILI